MRRPFVVRVEHGPAWDAARPLEQQAAWETHATFMDALFDEGFVAFAGPLEGTNGALLIIRADSEAQVRARLAADPWHRDGHLLLRECWPWEIRLGSLDSSP
ncbi:MAG TPA: YciI family protein [Vicinamibacterales bacterium]|nr:YciI family protein [Vicinamibacterales bacterium]